MDFIQVVRDVTNELLAIHCKIVPGRLQQASQMLSGGKRLTN